MRIFSKGHRPPPGDGNKGEPSMEGFDPKAFEASASGKSVMATMGRYFMYEAAGICETAPEIISYWENKGIRKKMFDAEADGGIFRYSVHTPLELMPGNKYPVIYFSHGGNGNPFQAEMQGFSELAAKEDLIIVYPHNGGVSNECAQTEFPRIMAALKEKSYPIDWSRVYAVGFSSGSDATELIAACWPEMIAAAAPIPGSNAMYNSLCRLDKEYYEKCLSLQMPVIFVGGTMDFGDRYPYPDQECFDNFTIWMNQIAKVKNYPEVNLAESQKLVAESNDPVVKAIGLKFHKTWVEHFEERDWYFGEYYNAEGLGVCRFILGEGLPHVITGCQPALVWDYLKHWSRDPETGESIYTPVVVNGVN